MAIKPIIFIVKELTYILLSLASIIILFITLESYAGPNIALIISICLISLFLWSLELRNNKRF